LHIHSIAPFFYLDYNIKNIDKDEEKALKLLPKTLGVASKMQSNHYFEAVLNLKH